MALDDDTQSPHAAPAWLNAMAQRLEFFAQNDAAEDAQALRAMATALHDRAADDDSAGLLRSCLHACLDVFDDAVASREDLRSMRDDLAALSALARHAIDGDRDDRPLLAYAQTLNPPPGPASWAARVPGRVVWLAAMAGVPGEEGAAAAMLMNDLAAVDPALPLRALDAALRSRG